jgi:hypothetical protein
MKCIYYLAIFYLLCRIIEKKLARKGMNYKIPQARKRDQKKEREPILLIIFIFFLCAVPMACLAEFLFPTKVFIYIILFIYLLTVFIFSLVLVWLVHRVWSLFWGVRAKKIGMCVTEDILLVSVYYFVLSSLFLNVPLSYSRASILAVFVFFLVGAFLVLFYKESKEKENSHNNEEK